MPTPPPAPQRLVIVACGARKAACFEAPAGEMYLGGYHRAARRAADAIATPGTRVMILSARYGLLDLDDRILPYDMRLGQRFAITAEGLREQAEQLGLLPTAEVVAFAPAQYANLVTHVWPHAQRPLAGTRGGEQMARFTALATGRITVADLVPAPAGTAVSAASPTAASRAENAVSIRGGLVHLADTPPGRAGALVPVCSADRPGRRWALTHAWIACTRCAVVVARRGGAGPLVRDGRAQRARRRHRDRARGYAGRSLVQQAEPGGPRTSWAASTGQPWQAAEPTSGSSTTRRHVPPPEPGRLAARPGSPTGRRPARAARRRPGRPSAVPPPVPAASATTDRTLTTAGTPHPDGAPASAAPAADQHRPANPSQTADQRKYETH